MECPNCGKEYPDNFCGNCGKQLKKGGFPLWEKCHECGKMEPIGREVCLTKLAEANKKREDFFDKAGLGYTKNIRIFFVGLIGFLFLFALDVILTAVSPELMNPLFPWTLIAVFLLPMLHVCFSVIYLKKKLKKTDKEFSARYSDEYEIILRNRDRFK